MKGMSVESGTDWVMIGAVHIFVVPASAQMVLKYANMGQLLSTSYHRQFSIFLAPLFRWS